MDLLAKAVPRGSVIGRYVLLDEVAAGAMASVCVARVRGDTLISDTVCVKRLNTALLRDADFVATAVEEARRASFVRHPNLLVPQDVVLDGRELLFVSAYVPGETLAILFGTCFRCGIRMPPAIAVAVVRDLLRGLHAAHEAVDDQGRPQPVIHRGVSPQNVLVGLDGRARLFDFGLAAGRMRAQVTPAVFAKGKSSYMSPEQIRRQTVDRRTDIFAAGAILWELLTGERLFRDTGELELTRQITQHHVPAPSSVQPGAPAALDQVVEKALQRSAADRWATAAEFADALEAVLAPAPAAEIGRWVEELDSDRLRARAQLVALAESAIVEPMPASEIPQSFGSTVAALAVNEPVEREPYRPEPPPRLRPAQAGLPVIMPRKRAAPLSRPSPRRRGRPLAALGLLAGAALALTLVLRGGDGDAPPAAVTTTAPALATIRTPTPSIDVGRVPPPAPRPRPRAAVAVARTRPMTLTVSKQEDKKPAMSRPPTRSPGKGRTSSNNSPRATHALLKVPPSKPSSDRSRARARVAAAARGDGAGSAACDPPFTVDTDGIRRIKRQCLR